MPARADGQDEWLVGLLTAGPRYTLDDDTLRLELDGTVVELTDRVVADPDRPLEGTEWHLDGIVDGDVVSSVPAGTGAMVGFADGELTYAVEGCNSASAAVEVEDGTLQVLDVISTLMACSSPAGDVEAALLEVLQGDIAYEIDAGTLTLRHPGGRGLTFRAAE